MPVWEFKPNARRPELQLTPFQSWILTTRARCAVGVAARRSGKTVGLRGRIISECLDSSPGDVGYMAPTLGQAKRLLWRPLVVDLRRPETAAFVEGRPNHSELTVEFKSGTRLYLFSAEAAERVRGDGFKFFATDETDDPIYTDDIFDEIIWPALADNRGRLFEVGSPRGRGRLYREYQKGRKNSETCVADYASRQVTAIEAGLLDPDEIERARSSLPPRTFAQEYLATFNAPIGIVYEEWNEKIHVVKADAIPRRFDYCIVGVDWGEATRGAMVVFGVDRAHRAQETGERPRVWALFERSEPGIPYTDAGWWAWAREIQMRYEPTHWYCDPAGGDTVSGASPQGGYLTQLRKALAALGGQYGHPRVEPANNRVRPGISAVQQMLHFDPVLKTEPHLFVSEACSKLIEEFPRYRRRAVRGSENEFEEEVVKEEDHCLDATRYGITTHFFSRPDRRRREEGAGWGEEAA